MDQAVIRKIFRKLDDTLRPKAGAWADHVEVKSLDQLGKTLHGLPPGPSHLFFANLHDNIVAEVQRLEPYLREGRQLAKFLRLFEELPAKEGGISVLGILAQDSSWCLLVRADEDPESLEQTFHGTAAVCDDLRSRSHAVRKPQVIPRSELVAFGTKVFPTLPAPKTASH